MGEGGGVCDNQRLQAHSVDGPEIRQDREVTGYTECRENWKKAVPLFGGSV